MMSLRWHHNVSNAARISLCNAGKRTFIKPHHKEKCLRFRLIRLYSTRSTQNLRIYVIAGEASGDAIGAKLIRALQREQTKCSLGSITFQGIGGPLMSRSGNFTSLFPMDQLSIMGLVEILPYLYRFRRHIKDTVVDIQAFDPDAVITIDSKGFSFRVHQQIKDSKLRARRFHYVAPSIWAYKHRKNKKFDGLAALVDHLFVLLPFEKILLDKASTKTTREWCTFVGHPSIEEFLERYHAFDTTTDTVKEVQETHSKTMTLQVISHLKAPLSHSLLKDYIQAQETEILWQKTVKFYEFIQRNKSSSSASFREKHGIKPQAFVICALVGSREHEVKRCLPVVQEAIAKLSTHTEGVVHKDIYVIYPTLSSLAPMFSNQTTAASYKSIILTDLTHEKKLQVFQSSNLAIATSGTIVMETCLASLPTIVIYKANKLTEWIVKGLANVEYVSLPNLLIGFPFVSELLFSQCTSEQLYELVKKKYADQKEIQIDLLEQQQQQQLTFATTCACLVPWTFDKTVPIPVRPSDVAAIQILNQLFT